MKVLSRFSLIGIFFSLAACQGVFPGVFRIDVAQGNILSERSLDALELGLEKQQVLYVLGTPLIEDVFNAGRWDYFYYFSERGGAPNVYRVTLHFDAERLARIEKSEHPIRAWHERKKSN